METSTFPKWFWIALGAIVIITIGSVMYCNWKRKKAVTEVSETLTESNNDQALDLNSIDLIPSLQNVMS